MPEQHPLRPLSAEEVQAGISLLKTLPEYNAKTRVISLMLKEPAKEAVFTRSGRGQIPREARAILFDNGINRALRVDLDLTDGRICGVVLAPEGAQPTLSIDEQEECERAVLASEAFRAALERHYGVSDTSLVMVDIWSAGNYGSEEDRTRRIARPLCFLRRESGENGYVHPLEGLRPVVDLNSMEVLRVEEHGIWPLPEASVEYAADRISEFRQDLKPLTISQPEGPSFTLEGNQISWQKWRMVIGFNAREALTIHDLQYFDNGRYRPILYRGSMTEMVVPYGDPRPTQVRKNAFDVGEYGMGMCTNSLRLGCDCVGHIQYLDAHLCTSRGEPLTIANAICIHEEDYGILWKHTDRRIPDKPEVRRSRRLVISCVATVENYEYGFFWYFYQDGNIQFEIKLTGVLSLSATLPQQRPAHGAMLKECLFAPNHQHFFNVRLDMAVDGINNTVQQVDVVADPLDDANPFANAFHAVATDLKTEKDACANLNLETGRTWKIVNPAVKNIVGEPVGYRFFGGDNAVPFGAPGAWWRKRAGFVEHHVWVTRFDEEERYAAGDYPNQSDGTDGLLTWIEKNRSIENADLVFWYTFGHTHLPRLEDYPVMPTAYIGFLLKPSGFFDINPGNDLAPSEPIKAACCG